MKPGLAKSIRITGAAGTGRIEIDGQEFPWYISEEGPRVSGLARNQLAMVTVDIPADHVEVDVSLMAEKVWPKMGLFRRLVRKVAA